MEGIEPSILRPEHSVIPFYYIPRNPVPEGFNTLEHGSRPARGGGFTHELLPTSLRSEGILGHTSRSTAYR